MAWRIEHIEGQALDIDAIAFCHTHGDDVSASLLAHYGDAMRAVAQRTKSGDMVGMEMSVDRLDQFEIKLAHELQIAVDFFKYRIDDQRLAAMLASDEIRIGARNTVEKLAEDHRRLPSINLPGGEVFSPTASFSRCRSRIL
jgi:hypothetical protein